MKTINTKTCYKCHIDKPLTEFHKHKGRKQGVTDYCKICRNNYIVEKRHGLKEGEVEEMKLEQDYSCAICGVKDENILPKGLAVDHDHETGKVRGLLCTNCNNGLGRFKKCNKIFRK